MKNMESHYNLMQRAIELAMRARGQTRPNPIVGAVVVKDGRVIGEGWHRRAGEPHAEREALAASSGDARGATMYVTLEPCNHTGRTPPCVDAVIEAGIERIVIGQRDPNPAAEGGVDRLRAAGIEVVTGVCEEECRLLNPAFNTYHQLRRPLVTLKWAVSADGCTSCEGGHSAWISGEQARRRAHELRAESDSVLVGVETALRDAAKLTIRDAEIPPGPPLKRMVLDTTLRIPPDHALFEEKSSPAIVVCGEGADAEAEERLRGAGAEVWRVDASNRRIDVSALLKRLHEENVQSVLVEGGRRVGGAFFEAGLVDRVMVFMSPVLIASGGSPLSALVAGNAPNHMSNAMRLHHVQWEIIEEDGMLEAWHSNHLFE